MKAGFKQGLSHSKGCAGCHRALRPHGHPYTFVLSQTDLSPHQAASSQRSESIPWTSADTSHTAGAQQLFVHGRLESREKGRESRAQKTEPILHPEHSPAPWLLPKARPSSALGNKYLYGDNYSIWEENPIKQEPCRAANAGTELRQQLRQAPVCSQ